MVLSGKLKWAMKADHYYFCLKQLSQPLNGVAL